MNLNQVTLPVKNMAQVTNFYLRLGFIQIVNTPHYAQFECPDGHPIFLLSLQRENFSNGSIIYFEHQHIDEWVKQRESRGITLDQLPTEQGYLYPSDSYVIHYLLHSW